MYATPWKRSSCALFANIVRQHARNTPSWYRVRNSSSNTAQHVTPVPSTKLEKIVRDTIKATGPMSVSMYMSLCLGHPSEGYYTSSANPIFGAEGDFITSPEISQVFGELIAIWHLTRWHAAGKPPRIRIIELGPGRGTLLADALRIWAQFPECARALSEVQLVETSEPLRQMQRKRLYPLLNTHNAPTPGVDAKEMIGKRAEDFLHWRHSLEDVSLHTHVDDSTFTMVIAHEFFDALPVHIIEKGENGWYDIQITTASDPAIKTVIKDPNAPTSLPPLRFTRSPAPTASAMLMGNSSSRFSKLPIGSRIEVSPTGFKISRQIAELVNHRESAGGSALIIDYGKDMASGNSLRAFKKHKIVDVFETPGKCDMTANVDFAYLKEAIADAAMSHGPITQEAFLKGMNIEARVAQLTMTTRQIRGDGAALAIPRAARRLVDSSGMGAQYKFLGITGSGSRKPREEGAAWPFAPLVIGKN